VFPEPARDGGGVGGRNAGAVGFEFERDVVEGQVEGLAPVLGERGRLGACAMRFWGRWILGTTA